MLTGAAALERAGLKPVTLGCKEGLTLTNGTHSVNGIAVLATYDAIEAAKAADVAAAVSLEALRGTINAFDPRLQTMKRHPEQSAVAANVRRILAGSEIVEKFRDYRVQDTYSLRAIPQMHGGAKRALKDALKVVEDELHSVGDNPVIFPEGDDGVALMGANFDSTFVGIQADLMVTSMTVLAKISERRTDRMVNSAFSELPAFLSPNPGLHNGYMIPQYTAAALYMEMKAASMPASVDSVPTSANQEDPVSNAYLAATKAYQLARKLRYVLAIELMCAAQAHDLLDAGRASEASNAVYQTVRSAVPPVVQDRFFGDDIERLQQLVLTAPSRESWKTWWEHWSSDAPRAAASVAGGGAQRLCLLARDSVCEIDERVRGGDLVSILVPCDSDDSSAHSGDLQHTDPVSVWVHREPWQDSGADAFCGQAEDRAVVVGTEDDLVAQGGVTEAVLDEMRLADLGVTDERYTGELFQRDRRFPSPSGESDRTTTTYGIFEQFLCVERALW